MMKHQEGCFKGIRDTSIYHQAWLPDGDAQAVLIVVHGLADHCGRYLNLVNRFVPLGYALYGFDHIGHGRSGGQRVYVKRFQELTVTLGTFIGMVRQWQSDKPIFLLGHSMGALITAAYLIERQDELSGAVLSGPGVKVPENISPGTILAGRILSALAPKAGLLTLDAQGVSRDPAVVQAYINDPLVHTGRITARMAAELLKTMQRVSAESEKINLPILILQGGADRMVDPSGAQMLHERIGSRDKTIQVYDGLYHEIFNEPERGQVLRDMAAWLASHHTGAPP